MPFIAIAAAIILALGGGASFAANSSLPGDALYPIKVGVNENIESALSFSDKEKANTDILAVDTRMEESEKLSAEGRLGSSTQADINANLDAHVKAVEARIAQMQADGDYSDAAEVAAKFQATVARHASVLAAASAHADVHAQAALAQVISRVQATLNAASNLSASASAQAAAHGDTELNDKKEGTTSANTSGHVQTGTRVKVDANGDGIDDGVDTSGNGGVNVRL